ncbi:hypothetical protein HAP47_0005290 [Bradyrhizobium sp. 41S5]|uniref:hypothetical protein n=1 Tax=Bradyrhizobium sp. 41S5 TaxID=1404443 RepID=UPI00156B9047|nr:hypothetical protein [Bradyrhizobium sp. 41S5]UFX46126.1 hypothetical protein HAP47_0005290 [Bradyrhizobium sp. 41S5]
MIEAEALVEDLIEGLRKQFHGQPVTAATVDTIKAAIKRITSERQRAGWRHIDLFDNATIERDGPRLEIKVPEADWKRWGFTAADVTVLSA